MPSGVYVQKLTKNRRKISKTNKRRLIWNKNLTKETDERLVKMGRNISKTNKGKIPWNKNLTKEMDERLAKAGRNISKSKKGHLTWNIGLTKETDERIVKIGRSVSKSLTGYKQSKEHRERVSNALIGKMPKNLNSGTFGNIKCGWYDINGKKIFLRSGWEANYALYLDFLIKQKQIKKWEYEKDVFIFEKIKFGTRSYRPDFKIYNNDGDIEYHEVKGWMTPKSKTKIKRMAKYYPEIKLIIIDGTVYGDIKKKLGKKLKFY